MRRHITIDELESARRSGDGIRDIAEHVAQCRQCRAFTTSAVHDAVAALVATLEKLDNHLDDETVAAWVDGTLPRAAADTTRMHLEECASCADDINTVKGFRGVVEAEVREHVRLRRRLLAFAAVFATVLIGLAYVARRAPRTQPVQVAVVTDAIRDGDHHYKILSDGRIEGIDLPERKWRDAVSEALTASELRTPDPLSALQGQRGKLLGAADGSPITHLTAPLGVVVEERRPLMQWRSDANATFEVVIFDAEHLPVARASGLRQTRWRTDRDLLRGRTYYWQVIATIQQTSTIAPVPPDPPAIFKVLSEEDATEIDAARRAEAGHLVQGLLYARAGVLEEAEKEFAALASANPGSAVAAGLLRQVRSWRSN